METFCHRAFAVCCVQILLSGKHAALQRSLPICVFILHFSLDADSLAGTEGMNFLQTPHQTKTSKKRSLLPGYLAIGVDLEFPGQILISVDIYAIESKIHIMNTRMGSNED